MNWKATVRPSARNQTAVEWVKPRQTQKKAKWVAAKRSGLAATDLVAIETSATEI
jgi:hypothetical protein